MNFKPFTGRQRALSPGFCLALLLVLGIGWLAGSAGAAAPPPAAAAAQHTGTPDRLAAPPTVENPSQADEGAQLFWLHCQPCHGDVGQGLTEDWRAQYPPEDQNCWASGCHGRSPYENGFTLPTAVPPVIGAGSLGRFGTAADLHAFISQAMPYQDPASLAPAEYWALTAYLARAHGTLPDDTRLETTAAAASIPISASAPPTATPTVGSAVPTWAWPALCGVVVLGGLAVWAWRRARQARVGE